MESVYHLLSLAKADGAEVLVLEVGKETCWIGPRGMKTHGEKLKSDDISRILLEIVPDHLQVDLAMGEPVRFEYEHGSAKWSITAETNVDGMLVQAEKLEDEVAETLPADESMELDLDFDEEPLSHAVPEAARRQTADYLDPIEDSPPRRPAQSADDDAFDDMLLPDLDAGSDDAFGVEPDGRSAVAKSVDFEDTHEIDVEYEDGYPAHTFDRSPTPAVGLKRHTLQSGEPTGTPSAPREAEEARTNAVGIPEFVADEPYASSAQIFSGVGNVADAPTLTREGSMLLLCQDADLGDLAQTMLGVPCLRVGETDQLSTATRALREVPLHGCVLVDVEDPSAWFGWIMRRLEEGRFVLVVCRALDEAGALRVLIGLNPQKSCAKWISAHRFTFLDSQRAVREMLGAEPEKLAAGA